MTGFHVFQKGRPKADLFSGLLRREWSELEDSVRREYEARAEFKRKVAQSQAPPLDTLLSDLQAPEPADGPWKLSSQGGLYTLNPLCVEHTLDGKNMRKCLGIGVPDSRQRRFQILLFQKLFPSTGPSQRLFQRMASHNKSKTCWNPFALPFCMRMRLKMLDCYWSFALGL